MIIKVLFNGNISIHSISHLIELWDIVKEIADYDYEFVLYKDSDGDNIKLRRDDDMSGHTVNFERAKSAIQVTLPQRTLDTYIVENGNDGDKCDIVDVECDSIKNVSNNGTQEWRNKDGLLHRDDGNWWYLYGKRHREDGPAIEYGDGNKSWYIDGQNLTEKEFDERTQQESSSTNSTKKVFEDGTKKWRNKDGQYHRQDGPAIEWSGGSKEWWKDGLRHRENGPAVERSNGIKSWYINGLRHREDGPAIEYADGSKWWYIDGKILTEEEFNETTHPESDSIENTGNSQYDSIENEDEENTGKAEKRKMWKIQKKDVMILYQKRLNLVGMYRLNLKDNQFHWKDLLILK